MGLYKNKLDAQSFYIEWETARLRVLHGLKKLGRDIPLTCCYDENELKKMAKRKRKANEKS